MSRCQTTVQEDMTYHTIVKLADHALCKNGKVCPPATSEDGARRPAINCKL
jgi:hypothetical protein